MLLTQTKTDTFKKVYAQIVKGNKKAKDPRGDYVYYKRIKYFIGFCKWWQQEDFLYLQKQNLLEERVAPPEKG